MRIRLIGLMVIISIGIFLLSTTNPNAYMTHPLIGKKALNVVLEDVKSVKVQLHDLIKDKKSIVVFWTTWCPYCRTTIQDLVKRHQQFKQDQVQLILVNIAENKNKVLSFLKDLRADQISMVMFDVDQSASEQYKVRGIPTIFFITPEGVIAYLDGRVPFEYKDIF